MTVEQIVEIAASVILVALPPVLHAAGVASQPWARVCLSLVVDVVGAYRRAKGQAGAAGAPNAEPK